MRLSISEGRNFLAGVCWVCVRRHHGGDRARETQLEAGGQWPGLRSGRVNQAMLANTNFVRTEMGSHWRVLPECLLSRYGSAFPALLLSAVLRRVCEGVRGKSVSRRKFNSAAEATVASLLGYSRENQSHVHI